jgi:hypothetical protein
VLLIVIVLTLVFTAIAPEENTTSLHHIKMPLTNILTSIGPAIVTFAVNVVVQEFALVYGSIGPPEHALTLLFAVEVVSSVGSLIWPFFVTASRLSIFIPGSLKVDAIFVMIVVPVPVILAIHPLALIYVSIRMDHAALTICYVAMPNALINRAISAKVNSKALSITSP